MKPPDIHKTRHALMAFVLALQDDGHTAANVVAVLRELVAHGDAAGVMALPPSPAMDPQRLRELEQERCQREHADFHAWWDANQVDPQHTMVVQNAAHAAWQERARRAAGVQACPNAAHMGEHACANKAQCWEPCGELGNDERFVRVAGEKDTAAINKALGVAGTLNDQGEKA